MVFKAVFGVFNSLRKELEEMRKLCEKSKVGSKISPNFSPQDSIRSSPRDKEASLNGAHRSRIPGTTFTAGGPPDETQMDDIQAANCVIS